MPHAIMLCYAMLCYALQGAVPELSFIAKPYQPNRHDDKIVLVDPLEGEELDTPTTYEHPRHGHNHEPAHDHYHSHNYSPDRHVLSNHNPDLGPQHFMNVGYSSAT